MTIVILFRDFQEDNRMSMERYADGLRNYLNQSYASKIDLVNFTPVKDVRFGNGVWAMRFSRYLFYPLQARKQSGAINHIIDHAYAHLLYVLDPQKTIVSVHDLIPLIRWQGGISGISRGRKPWLNIISFRALNRARHLITASQNTKNDLIMRLQCDPQKISVIPYGVDPCFKPYSNQEKEKVCRQWGLPNNGAFRVLLSGSQFYKNQQKAVRAVALFKKITGKPCFLVKIGPPNEEWNNAIELNNLRESSACFSHVPLERMAELYNCVDCLLFPSLYEGFGWPPLEAMACGVPVVASRSASLPEVISDAGILCDAEDIEGLAKALIDISANAELKSALITKGISRANLFSWEKTVEKIFALYEQILNE
ncbi:MAG: glycosyltransferase family 4 protein [Anaerolineae bacterium]|nr:glycosyltransferase family 4 protein [Anaerolineae bacterium]